MWNDSKFADDFTPEDKYFWLMLLTTRYGNLAGCFEFSKKQMANDSGYNEQTIDNLIYRFVNIHKMIDYDYETKEVLILNWYKYNWTTSPKFEIAIRTFIEKIKSNKFKNHIIKSYENYIKHRVAIPYQYLTDSISIRDSIDVDRELKESIKEKKAKSNRFVKPTLDEIKIFLKEQEYDTDIDGYANRFYNFYESKGWKVGKEKMKDWKAAIRGWLSRDNIGKTDKKETVEVETNDDESVWEEIKNL